MYNFSRNDNTFSIEIWAYDFVVTDDPQKEFKKGMRYDKNTKCFDIRLPKKVVNSDDYAKYMTMMTISFYFIILLEW
jgi:hypothetical protein